VAVAVIAPEIQAARQQIKELKGFSSMKERKIVKLKEHIVEIVSDAGEGAQKAGTSFAEVCARSGNGLWTVEIIPSEIQPPPHTVGSASGNRIRLADKEMTNAGDMTNCIVAFNEMSLLSRVYADALDQNAYILIDNMWADHHDEKIRKNYREILDDLKSKGATVYELPMDEETKKVVDDPKKGKNMFVVGLLTFLYDKDVEVAKNIVKEIFSKKPQFVIDNNVALIEAGYKYGFDNLDIQFQVSGIDSELEKVAMNGNTAIALGSVAAGFEICSMYPITPATSASHELSGFFEEFGGVVHQAEDEIAAIGAALGASYAGVPAITITSGPGMALKTEFQGLAVMSETPLVIVNVQRGGPSTGLPTKIEQGDLLSSIFATPGDAPKVVIAPSNIEESFHIMTTARKIAEEFRMLVIVLTDANLATGRQLFTRPKITEDTLPAPLDLSPVPEGTKPFDWDEETGLSKRLIPGQPNGMYVATGLNHKDDGVIVYDSESNQKAHQMRSRKFAVLQSALKTPPVYGKEDGDLLIVSWGSTKGAIDEAADRLRGEGLEVSTMNIQFLSPLPSGLKNAFKKFKKVMTIELNYSDDLNDPYITPENRRYGQLATLLRANTLVDVDTWSVVPGRPLRPMEIADVMKKELEKIKNNVEA
jgi:2-oxoglutarate ferredoxin oxidoreductase subunit alpha